GTVVDRLGHDRRIAHIRLPEKKTLEEAERALSKLSEVATLERDIIYHATAIPNDPLFPQQWGLESPKPSADPNDPDIDAPQAWDESTGGKSVVIGVIDSGVDYKHQDLADNLWRNPHEIPGNGKDDDHNGWVDDVFGIDAQNNDGDPKDDDGHGTHVVGT